MSFLVLVLSCKLGEGRRELISRMDYFAFSPFWDPKSNNNVLRVQRRIEQPNYGHAEEKMYVVSKGTEVAVAELEF
jgi:hypothetical protein